MLSSALRACWTSHVNLSQRETNIGPNERRRQLLVVFQSKEAVLFLLFVDKTPARDHHLILWKLEWNGGEKMCYCPFPFFFFSLLHSKLTRPDLTKYAPRLLMLMSAPALAAKSHIAARLRKEKANNEVMKLKMQSSQIQVSTWITAKCHCSLFFPPLQSSLAFKCKNYHLSLQVQLVLWIFKNVLKFATAGPPFERHTLLNRKQACCNICISEKCEFTDRYFMLLCHSSIQILTNVT